MEPNDPKQTLFLKRLSELMQLRRYLRLEAKQPIGKRMEELAREMTSLKLGDPRRAEIVEEIMQLRDMLKEL